MNERKKFALGILIGLVVLTLVAFVPSLTDFNSGQFNTDNRTVTIGAAVPLTNASLRSSAAYQKDINSLAFSVSVYNTSTITNVEEWRSIPYPAGSPNMLGNVDMNGNLFMTGNGNFGSGAAAGTPSAIRLIDSTTGKYWQWSELGAQSNIIERLPTNGNNGLSWGIKMWTNAAIASDGTPTNQAMNFQLGTGLSVDWANRQITASASSYDPIQYASSNVVSFVGVGASTFANYGNINWAVISGVAGTIVSGSNGFPRLLTFTNTPSQFACTIGSGGNPNYDIIDTNNVSAIFTFRLHGNLTSNYTYCCHCNTTTGPGSAFAPTATFGWKYVTAGSAAYPSDTHWVAYSNDGITTNAVDSGLVCATNVNYALWYKKVGSNIVYGYTSGGLSTTVVTNNYLPATASPVSSVIQHRMVDIALTNASSTRLEFVRFHEAAGTF